MAYGRNDRDFPSRGQDGERQTLAGRWVHDDEAGGLQRRFDDERGSDEAYRRRAPANRAGAAGYYDRSNRRGDGGSHAFDFARRDRSDFGDREDQRFLEGGGRVSDPDGYATRSDGGFEQDDGDRGGRAFTGPSRGVWPQKDNWISHYASADGPSSGEPPVVQTESFRGRGPKGYVRSGERIKEDVSDRLSDDDTLDAPDITVEVSAGEVALSGYGDSRQAKHTAEDCAEQCVGVVHVQNNLRVRTATGQGSNGQPGEPTKTTAL